MSNRRGALSGIRVLDLTRVMSGPYASAMLADLGAEVLKIESIGSGDLSRLFGPHVGDESAYALMLNRGKESLTVDLKHEAGRKLTLDLAAKSDVVIENFRPGVAARLGLDYDSVKAVNAEIIYASISGFGSDSPLADHPAFDLVVQAMSGLMSVTGQPDSGATAVGESLADVSTGMFASWGILAALIQRERTGRGANIEVAMLDSVVSMLLTPLSRLLYTDEPIRLVGNRHPETYPVDAFDTNDGQIVLVVPADPMMAGLAAAISAPSLIEDPRFANNSMRNRHEAELREVIANWAKTVTTDQALKRLAEQGIPCGPVRSLAEATSDEHARIRGIVREASHPTLGTIPVVEQPVHFGDQSHRSSRHRMPRLGADTDAVLGRVLGMTATEISALRDAGAIGNETQVQDVQGGQ